MWLAEINFLFNNNFEKIKYSILSDVSKLNYCGLQKITKLNKQKLPYLNRNRLGSGENQWK